MTVFPISSKKNGFYYHKYSFKGKALSALYKFTRKNSTYYSSYLIFTGTGGLFLFWDMNKNFRFQSNFNCLEY